MNKPKTILVTAFLVVTALLAATPVGAGTTSGNLPNGAAIDVSIDDPLTSSEFMVPVGSTTIDVDVTGSASVGIGAPDATIVMVIDGSGSTGFGSGTGCSPILNCEKQFFNGLNAEAFASGSVADAGVAVFGAGAVTADMQAAGGDQLLTTAAADVTTVINSVTSSGGVGQYTAKSSGGGATNFTAGLNAATTILAASASGTKIVVFASDGGSNTGGGGFGAALASLAGTGAVAYTVAIGAGNLCTDGSAGTLQQIADDTGGACYQVPDPGDLPDIIPDLISTSLDSLHISEDGGSSYSPIGNADIDPDLPQDGPVTVAYDTTVTGLGPGDHEICVKATGSDPGGSTSVEVCETIHVFGLVLEDELAVNELGSDNQHTVTAKLFGEHEIEGREIIFKLNGEVVAIATLGASRQVTLTYLVLVEPGSLGMDIIEACFTPEGGEEFCVEAVKEWVDTTPPGVECLEAENPHGETKPGAPGGGGQGQNQDGFYELTAEDDVWPPESLALFVEDTGSGVVFGPFEVGTLIKWTEASAAPTIKKIGSEKGNAGAVDYHIKGNGDAALFAVDGSGNESDPTYCLVPPPPK